MTFDKFYSNKSILFFLTLTILIIFSNKYVYSYDFYFWENGIDGHETALSNAKKDDKPLIVYFHIESSIWNERMNNEYLSSVLIEDYLMEIPKVEINPERKDSEKDLASKYKLEQFPAFLIFIPSINNDFKRIHPFSETDMSAEEFLNTIKETISYEYNSKAFSYFEKKEYDEALKYYNMSSTYNPESAYTYYAIGTVYNYIYYNDDKSLEFLKRAEESYKKALEVNPDHEESKIELEKLEKELMRVK